MAVIWGGGPSCSPHPNSAPAHSRDTPAPPPPRSQPTKKGPSCPVCVLYPPPNRSPMGLCPPAPPQPYLWGLCGATLPPQKKHLSIGLGQEGPGCPPKAGAPPQSVLWGQGEQPASTLGPQHLGGGQTEAELPHGGGDTGGAPTFGGSRLQAQRQQQRQRWSEPGGGGCSRSSPGAWGQSRCLGAPWGPGGVVEGGGDRTRCHPPHPSRISAPKAPFVRRKRGLRAGFSLKEDEGA